MKDAGVLIGLGRPHGSALEFRPPLVIDEGGIEEAPGALDAVLAPAAQ